jgi:hypothetical protein
MASTTSTDQQPVRRGNVRGFVAGETEARPGFITSEMWIMVLFTAVLVIGAYVSDTFSNDLGWALAAGVVASYILSRGLAKSGSKEGPFAARLGDGDTR